MNRKIAVLILLIAGMIVLRVYNNQKLYVAETETAIATAEREKVDLRSFLAAIRGCTEPTALTPTIVNTLIQKIEVFNSEKGADGKKHVPIIIHFRAAGIITIPDEKEILAAMEEIRKNPPRVA